MGIPQRRERVFLLASKVADPRDVLLAHDAGEPLPPDPRRWRDVACAFYWTEGLRGLGWAHDAVPTLKGGSTIGIASPPAIVLPSGEVVQPDLRDVERLQGFEPDWTRASSGVTRKGHRWKLVGNAVTVDVAAWIGEQLRRPGTYDAMRDRPLKRPGSWPKAAWGRDGVRHAVEISTWPVARPAKPLAEFLEYEPRPLSAKATAGFVSRAKQAKLRFPDGFLDLLEAHLETV
jgi:DNA (cytosine-5)-methyltransferase 1